MRQKMREIAEQQTQKVGGAWLLHLPLTADPTGYHYASSIHPLLTLISGSFYPPSIFPCVRLTPDPLSAPPALSNPTHSLARNTCPCET